MTVAPITGSECAQALIAAIVCSGFIGFLAGWVWAIENTKARLQERLKEWFDIEVVNREGAQQ